MKSKKPSAWIAGADGCRSGWFVVLWDLDTGTIRRRLVAETDALLALPEQPAVLSIDMIIGVPEKAEKGGRACDRAVRAILGWPRSASVFSPPCRAALEASTYGEALAANRANGSGVGLSKQAFYVLPKLRALDDCLTPLLQERVYEVHPELSFYAMHGNRPVARSKQTEEGQVERLQLLYDAGFGDVSTYLKGKLPDGVSVDDVLDAHAACWSAKRIAAGIAKRVPASEPPVDARGLRMEIWW